MKNHTISRPSRPQALRPPMLDGVSASVHVVKLTHGDSALDYLSQHLPALSREQWQSRLHAHQVLRASLVPLAATSTLSSGERIWYYRQSDVPEQVVPFNHEVVFENADILVVDKPHFLALTPKGVHVQETLLTRLKRQFNQEELTPAHRLDRDTAGLVLLTRHARARHAYQNLFAQRQVDKVYEAVAPWRADMPERIETTLYEPQDQQFMQMRWLTTSNEADELPTGVKLLRALTRVHVLRHRRDWAWYELEPITGRKHQLRAHLASQACPILGDRIYPNLLPYDSGHTDFSKPLQLLARRLSFVDPLTRETMNFVSRRVLDGVIRLGLDQDDAD